MHLVVPFVALGFAAYSSPASLKKGTIFFSECLRTLLDAYFTTLTIMLAALSLGSGHLA